jgi:hypothetical protein
MSLEQKIDNVVTATENLLNAVNIKKATLDATVDTVADYLNQTQVLYTDIQREATETNGNAEAAAGSATSAGQSAQTASDKVAEIIAVSSLVYGSGSMVDRLSAICDNSKFYIKRVGAEIAVGCSQSETHGTEFRLRLDDDGLFLLRGGFTNYLDPASVPIEASNFTGLFTLSDSNPTGSYAREIGASFDLNFTGTGLIFNHQADTNGGLWHFVIDGGDPIPVSVWSATSGLKASTVVTGLEDGQHTCVATYQGADPANPPYGGGNGRGWFVRGLYAPYSTGNVLIEGPATVRSSGARPALLAINSIPDFAINARPNSQPAMTSKWIPKHGADGGATRDITRSIIIDGINVGIDASVVSETPKYFRSIMVIQNYTAYCPSDVAGEFPLWKGNIVHKYSEGVMTVTHTLRFINDTFSAAGYFSMLPTDSRYANKLILDNNIELPVESLARKTTFDKPVSSVLYLNTDTGNAVAAEVSSINDVLGLRSKEYSNEDIFQEERTDNIAKVYWRRYFNSVIPAGTVERYQTKFVLAANNGAVAGL